MTKWIALSSAWLACLGMGSPATGQGQPYQMMIGGAAMSCLSWRGEPVRVLNNPSISTLGRAYFASDGKAVIEFNPGALENFSPNVQQWWFAHECAHHELPPQLNSEKRADCIASKRVRHMPGGAAAIRAGAFQREFQALRSSEMGHLAGPERARLVMKCAGIAPTANT